jgi:hypothetical protein
MATHPKPTPGKPERKPARRRVAKFGKELDELVERMDRNREEIKSRYGILPDSSALIREDRER